MGFTIPNVADALVDDIAEVDKVDIDILVAGYERTGMLSGGAVTAQGVPDLTLAVAAGVVIVAGVRATVSSGNVTITAADATNPRFDLVVVNNSGTKSVTAGTAAADPVFPAIPVNSAVLAAVYVPANDTAIADNQVTDKRVIIGTHGDDDIFPLGADDDVVQLLRSTALAADTELTDVIVGTSDHQGVAANSLIVSNITTDGDMIFLVSDAGDSLEFLRADGANARLTLGWGMTSLEFGLGGAKEMIYTTGVQEFQQATQIKTTAGNLTLFPASNIALFRTTIVIDNVGLFFGDNLDAGMVMRAGLALDPDTELTLFIEGTSNHQGVAADSLIISNVTNDGDIMMLVSDGGNSLEFLRADADVATVDIGFAMLITKFMAASTVLIEGDGTGLGFFATTPAAQPTGVAVTAAGIHAALVTLGLITA